MATSIAITSAGTAAITNSLVTGTNTILKEVQFGTGVRASAAVTDTALTNAIATVSTNSPTRTTTTHANDTLHVTQSYTTAVGSENITEAGLFFASGAMLCSLVFTGADIKPLTEVGSTVTFVFDINFAGA